MFGKASLEVFGAGKPPLLVIPSLINKSYILNFYDDSLVMRFASQYTVYLLNWGEVEESDSEALYNIDDYVQRILVPALGMIYERHASRVGLLGYCFGGIMALLFACVARDIIERVITIAMPFDFEKSGYQAFPVSHFDKLIPHKVIRDYFYLRNFESVNRKYMYSGFDEQFLKLEHWANDTINLSKASYMDIADNLLVRNSLYKDGTFSSGGREYRLASIAGMKVQHFVGLYDKVVPIESTCKTLGEYNVISTGHTGLVLKRDLYSNLLKIL